MKSEHVYMYMLILVTRFNRLVTWFNRGYEPSGWKERILFYNNKSLVHAKTPRDCFWLE